MPGIELGSAHIPIRADLDGLKKDLDSAHRLVGEKLSGVASAVAEIGKTVALAGAALGAGIAAVGVTSLKASSDASESLSKVGVVFGENAEQIEAWAATAAQSIGQSRSEALSAAGTLGNLFVSMGLGSKDAAGLSTEMVELASDLGSFNNIASSDALEKLRAGLVGEAEPLRALGVNMNAAMVEAKGLELGLADASGEMTEAAKVQARYAIIMEQTKTAQGDFSRTSTGMANAMKIIQASVGDLQVEIGDQLLPAIAPLISAFAQRMPDAITAVMDVVRPLIGELTGLATTAQNIAGEHGLGMIDAALIAIELKIGEAFGPDTQAAFHGVQEAVRNAAAFFENDLLPALNGVADFIGSNLTPILVGVGTVAAIAFGAWAVAAAAAAAATIVALAPVLIPIAAVGLAAAALAHIWTSNWGGIQDKTQAVVAFISSLPATIGGFFDRLGTAIHDKAIAIGVAAAGIGTAIVNGITNALNGAWQGLVNRLTGLVDLLPAAVRTLLGISSPSKVFAEIGQHIVDGLAEGLEAAPEAFGPIERALQAFRDREEDENRRHARKMEDLEANLGRAKGKEREAALRAIEEEEETHRQRVEDLQRDHSENMLRAERELGRERATIRRKAIEDLRSELVSLEGDLAKQADAIDREIESVRTRTAGSIAGLGSRRDESRELRARRDVEDEKADERERGFREARSAAELQYRWERDKEKAQLKHAEDLAEEDARFQKELALATARGELEAEGARIREDHRIRREALDTQKTEDIQAADAAWEAAKKEAARRRELEAEERTFRKEQEQLRRQFEDALADEALEKERTRLLGERDTRIRALETERDDLRQSYRDKVEQLKTEFLDKVGPLTEDEMGSIISFLDTITEKAKDAAAAITGVASVGGGDATVTDDIAAAIATAGGDSPSAPQTAAALLNALTATTGIGPGGQVGTGIVGAQSVTIELDGIAVGKAVVPYVEPELTRFGGSRIHGV